jgi:hypothetical protein
MAPSRCWTIPTVVWAEHGMFFVIYADISKRSIRKIYSQLIMRIRKCGSPSQIVGSHLLARDYVQVLRVLQ